MSEKKVPEAEKQTAQELDLDDLDAVQGGSLKDVGYTKTHDISKDTREKI